jgi:hypothetical protein
VNIEKIIQMALDNSYAEAAIGKMSLGDVISYLETRNPSDVASPGWDGWDSWRGVYMQLAFSPCNSATAGAMLGIAKEALAAGEMEGYKGGEYPVEPGTVCNVAYSGDCDVDADGLTLARLIGMFDAKVVS